MSAAKRRVNPVLEQLDTLRLLSSTVAAQIVTASRPVRPLASIAGTALATQTAPDVGRTIRLAGDAWVDGVGSVPFTGNLTATGFVVKGRAGGSIVFAGTSGTMTVTLVGPVQPGFATLPNKFNFQVTKAGAAFSGFKGAGTATFVQDDAGRFAIKFQPGIARPRR